MGGLSSPPTATQVTDAATLAWRNFCGRATDSFEPEILKNDRKTVICRLRSGSGSLRESVIAKRSATKSIEREVTIHREILSRLPVSSLAFYGSTPDDDPAFSWLFLEDAGEERCIGDSHEHRVLAASWLAGMHTAAQNNRAAQSLPPRGPDWYLGRLETARGRIVDALPNVETQGERIGILESLLHRLAVIETHWKEVASFCDGFPRTMVHCDFSPKNLRVQMRGGRLVLFPLDWETAGWAVPAADLAEKIDLDTYLSVVNPTWPDIHREQWQALRSYGRVFRIIATVEWATVGLDGVWLRRPLNYLETYNEWLAQTLQDLSWSSEA